jgi:hypothetical protein
MDSGITNRFHIIIIIIIIINKPIAGFLASTGSVYGSISESSAAL